MSDTRLRQLGSTPRVIIMPANTKRKRLTAIPKPTLTLMDYRGLRSKYGSKAHRKATAALWKWLRSW